MLNKLKTFSLQQVLILLFLFLFTLVVLHQANPLRTNLGRDSGIYMYVSNTFLKGELPYIDAYETKPPGIFFINAFALWLGQGTRWGIWFVEFIFLFASVCIGYFFLNKHFNVSTALIGSILWLYGLNSVLEGGNFTEEYSLLFNFIALFLWSSSLDKSRTLWYDFGIGLCTSFSFLLRPNNIGVEISIIIVMTIIYVLKRDYLNLLKRISFIGLGAILPIVGSGIYFYVRGAFPQLLEASLLYNLSYTSGNLNLLGAFSEGLRRIGFSAELAIIGYCAIGSQLWQQIRAKNISPIFLWAIITGVVEVCLSGLSGRNYPHYFMCWLPLIAFSSAFFVHSTLPHLFKWREENINWFVPSLLVVTILLFFGIFKGYTKSANQLLFNRENGVHKEDLVAEYVIENTKPADFVLVWGGQAGINFLSKRDAPTPYIFYPYFVPSEITDRISAQYYQDLQANPPVLIVDGSYYSGDIVPIDEKSPGAWVEKNTGDAPPYLLEILTFIHENYVITDIVAGVTIYRYNR